MANETQLNYTQRIEATSKEFDRLKNLVSNSDPLKVELLEGLLWEAARARVQLQELNAIAQQTGPIRVSAENPVKQMALPIVQELTKVRASYTHLMDRLMRNLDFSDNQEDDSFTDFL